MSRTLAIGMLLLSLPLLLLGQTNKDSERQAEAGGTNQQAISPVDRPSFDLDFSLDCSNLAFQDFCDKVKALPDHAREKDKSKIWDRYWPTGGGERTDLFVNVCFFIDPHNAELFQKYENPKGDLCFLLRPTRFDSSLLFEKKGSEVHILAVNTRPNQVDDNGKFQSIRDLQGATVVVFEYTGPTEWSSPLQDAGRKLLTFKMKFDGGQSFSYLGPFEKAQVLKYPAFRFVLPNPDQLLK